MSAKRFRIAFSFAGEKRVFVAQVAGILAKRFGADSILYDKYHKAEFSRPALAFYLPDLYESEADLVVAVFCPDYEKKDWCGLEWDAIYGLIKARKGGEVMLTRFERVEGKGLRGIAGYVDLDDLTADQAADLILERLALNEGKSKDHYKAAKTSIVTYDEKTQIFEILKGAPPVTVSVTSLSAEAGEEFRSVMECAGWLNEAFREAGVVTQISLWAQTGHVPDGTSIFWIQSTANDEMVRRIIKAAEVKGLHPRVAPRPVTNGYDIDLMIGNNPYSS